MRRSHGVRLGAAVLLWLGPSPARLLAQEPPPLKGPIPTRNAEPLNTPFLSPVPTDASVLPRGKTRIEANLDIANHLLTLGDATTGRYVTDFEEQRLHLVWARGLAGGAEIAVRVPLIARNGGILDEIINGWHDIVGKEGGGRGNLPRYRVVFAVTDAAGRTILADNDGAAGLGDITLEYRHVLNGAAAAPRTAVRALVKLPTGSSRRLLGSGAFDVGAGLALSLRPLRRLALHGNLAVVFVGSPRTPHLNPPRTLVHGMAAVEYTLSARTSLVAQSDDNPAPLRSAFAFANQRRRAFTLGLWHQRSAADRIYVSLSENQYGGLAKLAPDFTLSLGLRRDLR